MRPRQSGLVVIGCWMLALQLSTACAYGLDLATCRETSADRFAADKAAIRRSAAAAETPSYCDARRQELAIVSDHYAWASRHPECGRAHPDKWGDSVRLLAKTLDMIRTYNAKQCPR